MLFRSQILFPADNCPRGLVGRHHQHFRNLDEWDIVIDTNVKALQHLFQTSLLIAAGFLGSEKYVTDAFKVAINGRTNVDTKPEQYQTSVDKVFTAGDMHRGQSLVVWAIREGREAAKAVDESLMGYSYL